MIKISIDFRDATQSEIDAFYAVPGLATALADVQTNNRTLNTIVTIQQRDDRIGEVKDLILDFLRDHKVKAAGTIPEKPFRFSFVPSLNPTQKILLQEAIASLVDDGVLLEDGHVLRLTEVGAKVLY